MEEPASTTTTTTTTFVGSPYGNCEFGGYCQNCGGPTTGGCYMSSAPSMAMTPHLKETITVFNPVAQHTSTTIIGNGLDYSTAAPVVSQNLDCGCCCCCGGNISRTDDYGYVICF